MLRTIDLLCGQVIATLGSAGYPYRTATLTRGMRNSSAVKRDAAIDLLDRHNSIIVVA
jgi:hypothetical protein